MITDQKLDELEQLSERCDPGPWFAVVEGRDADSGDSFIQTGPDDRRGEDIYVTRDSGPADAMYLDLRAAARTYLPLLIAELRSSRASVVPEKPAGREESTGSQTLRPSRKPKGGLAVLEGRDGALREDAGSAVE